MVMSQLKQTSTFIGVGSQSISHQLASVIDSGYNIRFIENPSLEIQKAAVDEDSFAIQYIPNPCREIQLMAVKADLRAFKFIDNPCAEAIAFVNNPPAWNPFG